VNGGQLIIKTVTVKLAASLMEKQVAELPEPLTNSTAGRYYAFQANPRSRLSSKRVLRLLAWYRGGIAHNQRGISFFPGPPNQTEMV
jgi:hypothetical protein